MTDPIDGDLEVVALAVTPKELEHGSQRRVYVRSLKRCYGCRGDRPDCQVCGGEARIEDEWLAEVTVPAGAEISEYIEVPGMGEQGARGGLDGDLVVMLVPRRTGDPVDGADYTPALEVDEWLLREGGSERLELMGHGPCEHHEPDGCDYCGDSGWSYGDHLRVIKIPPDSRWGQWLRVRGEGMFGADGGKPGDLLVELVPPGHEDDPLPEGKIIDTTLAEPPPPRFLDIVEDDEFVEDRTQVGPRVPQSSNWVTLPGDDRPTYIPPGGSAPSSAPPPQQAPVTQPPNELNVVIAMSVPREKMREGFRHVLEYQVQARCPDCSGTGCGRCEEGLLPMTHVLTLQLGPYTEPLVSHAYEGYGYQGTRGIPDGFLILLLMEEGYEHSVDPSVPAPSPGNPEVVFYTYWDIEQVTED